MTQRDSQNNPLQLPQQPPLPPAPTWLDLKVKGQSLGREGLEFLTAVGRTTAQHRAADKPGSSSGTTLCNSRLLILLPGPHFPCCTVTSPSPQAVCLRLDCGPSPVKAPKRWQPREPLFRDLGSHIAPSPAPPGSCLPQEPARRPHPCPSLSQS